MARDVEITVIYDHFPELAKGLEIVVSQLVRKAAFDIQALAQASHPYQDDTGFNTSSIYVVTHDESTYGQGVNTPSGGATLLDEVEQPESKTEAIVAVGSSYGLYLEMGTVNMPAFPYLTPAAELVKPEFIAAMTTLERWLKALNLA